MKARVDILDFARDPVSEPTYGDIVPRAHFETTKYRQVPTLS